MNKGELRETIKRNKGYFFTAVQYTVTNGKNFALVLDDALFRIGKQGNNQLHTFHMGGEVFFAHNLFSLIRVRVDFVAHLAHGLADTPRNTGTHYVFVVAC